VPGVTDQHGEPDEQKHHRVRRWAPDDDLLTGFDRAGRPAGLREFFATTIGASLLIWDLAFTLGAYHTVFYSRLFQILVISTVLLMGSIVLRHEIKVRPWMRVLLAVPLVWLLARLVAPFGTSSHSAHVLDAILVGLTVASVPFTLWVVARILAPDYFALPRRMLKTVALVIIGLVAVAGFVVGQFNYRFTTCHDYVEAGDNTPSNCRPASPPSTPPPSTPASP
jgi:hypothetical protein